MAINLNNSNISKLYLGGSSLSKAYLGSTLIFGGAAGSTLLDGLVSYYKLDETSGTVATDTISAINGTLNQGSFTSDGKVNYGYNIPNTSGTYGITFGDTNHHLVINESKTYNAWFKPSQNTDNMVFMSDYNGTTGFYLAWRPDYHLYYLVANNASYRVNCQQGDVDINVIDRWYMITMVWTGTGLESGIKIYVDGVLASFSVLTNNIGGRSVTSNKSLSLSAFAQTGTIPMLGESDEFGIWDRELSSDEIIHLYNNSNANQYPFESYEYMPNVVQDLEYAYSFKKRVSTATKSFRIRRSNDNAETDVLLHDIYDCSINSEVSAGGDLSTWIGSNSGYVVTDYDQVGNHDVTQATQSKQPKVVNAGSWLGYKEYSGAQTLVGTTQVTSTLGSAYVYGTTPSGSQYFISQAKPGVANIFGLSIDGTTITKKIRTLDFTSGTNNVCIGTTTDNDNNLGLFTYRSSGTAYKFRTNSINQSLSNVNNGAWFGDHATVGDVIQKGGINWSSQLYSVHNEYETLAFTVEHTDAESLAIENSITTINPL